MDNRWMEEEWTDEAWDSEIDEEAKWERRERERQERRMRKREEMRRRKRRQRQIRRMLRLAIPLAGIILLAAGAGKLLLGGNKEAESQFQTAGEQQEPLADALQTGADENGIESSIENGIENSMGSSSAGGAGMADIAAAENGIEKTDAAGKAGNVYEAHTTGDTAYLGNIFSTNAVLIDVEAKTIVAQKDAKTIVNPASMTKVLTVLVAAEHITDLDDTFTITQDIIDYCFANKCSNAGFEKGETVTVRDLFYGTVLPSGADAAAGLAVYVAGSQEAFVDMMNDKLEELGLSETAHFTNCVGIYDERHYCTLYDMAMIMKEAMDNELCAEVLSAKTYTTSVTKEHPEGITISNWFLRRIEDKDAGGEVLGGKTGYVVQSGSCAASFGKSKSGREYICVTGNANSQWRCISDHADIYKRFME